MKGKTISMFSAKQIFQSFCLLFLNYRHQSFLKCHPDISLSDFLRPARWDSTIKRHRTNKQKASENKKIKVFSKKKKKKYQSKSFNQTVLKEQSSNMLSIKNYILHLCVSYVTYMARYIITNKLISELTFTQCHSATTSTDQEG